VTQPDLFSKPDFEPTLQAAQARLAAVRPESYARTRNHLEGAVTRLSPYLTHGFLTLPEVLRGVLQRHPLEVQHRFVFELGWREYFHHVWQHAGDAIFASLHEGPLPDAAYARELPADIRRGATGVPAIDLAVRELYATGWLHNHARLWLASYVVHLRKVHWRAGADWLYGHLLDGDLASNHLSWQWVAGTGSHKPYLFNADNVARHAPAAWHSAGSVVDRSYEALDRIARSAQAMPVGGGIGIDEPVLVDTPPPAFTAPDASRVAGRAVQLVHPWSLGRVAAAGALRVGVLSAEFHRAWPWSGARWHFVATRMSELCELLWVADAGALRQALAAAASVDGRADPHLPRHLNELGLQRPVRLFAAPRRRCASFTQFWRQVTSGIGSAGELLQRANGQP
jgi:deoxyribodipyrimidine photo-lyase